MDAIDNIIKRIEEDANWKIKEYWEKADEEIERIKKAEESKWEREKNKIETRGKREAETIKQMHISKAHLDGKKMLMNAREEIIDKIVEQILVNFRKYVDYERYIKSSIESAREVLGREFNIVAGKEDFDLVKKIAEDLGIKSNVMIGELKYGGILAISGDSLKKIDYSVKAYVDRNMGDIRKRIYTKLFGEEHA